MNSANILGKIRPRLIKGDTPFVVFSLTEWEVIEDILYEHSSPRLAKSVQQARLDYKKGKVVPLK